MRIKARESIFFSGCQLLYLHINATETPLNNELSSFPVDQAAITKKDATLSLRNCSESSFRCAGYMCQRKDIFSEISGFMDYRTLQINLEISFNSFTILSF